MDFEAIRARLQTRVPELRQIEDALSMAALVKSGALPRQSPAAWVVPAGLSAAAPAAATGMYIQSVTEIISVILSVTTHNAAGTGKSAAIQELIRAVIEALCGWGPDDAPGSWQLRRGELVSMTGGAVVWRIDFQIADEVRIIP